MLSSRVFASGVRRAITSSIYTPTSRSLSSLSRPSHLPRVSTPLRTSLFSIPSASSSPVFTPSLSPFSSHSHSLNASEKLLACQLQRLVDSFQRFSHLSAKIDPLGLFPIHDAEELSLASFSLKDDTEVSDKVLAALGFEGWNKHQSTPISTVAQFHQLLKSIYCSNFGAEFSHITNTEERNWISEQLQNPESAFNQSKRKDNKEERLLILKQLLQSELFDHFMQKRFSGVKRYGLEGGEMMISAVSSIFHQSSIQGVENVVIGMPHRGRLNLLSSVLKFPMELLFYKIQGNSEFPPDCLVSGDVLSHLAQSVDLNEYNSPLHVSLIHNPSHLELVNPVALGKVRSKQRIHSSPENNEQKNSKQRKSNNLQTEEEDRDRKKALALLIHGDAAFSAQGVIQESLLLSCLHGYTTGGSVHLIVNNQVGFTTEQYFGRSSRYSSDITKFIEAPIFHVNSESIQDVIRVCHLAVDYRQRFGKDVVIDFICYRRRGHNELDDPTITQPKMYKNIHSRPSVITQYVQSLLDEKLVSEETVNQMKAEINDLFESKLSESRSYSPVSKTAFEGRWSGFQQVQDMNETVDTGVNVETLKQVGLASVTVPPNFAVHDRLQKFFINSRIERLNQGKGLDWATCEALAFGTLVSEGYHVRISGQDVGRGTFAQRHVLLTDQNTNAVYSPLATLAPNPTYASFEAVNSPLSELAVLGFEYGYSINDPFSLVIWEAQFGDFYNGAQMVIDQFISGSELKWLRQTGVVLLLPHGFDGAGPEHSSAHTERFLQMAGTNTWDGSRPTETNLQVAFPTTPANYFHLLRRQMKRSFRKPLVVIGPKTLLRHSSAVSSFEEISENTHFLPVISDPLPPQDVRRVIFCSGKVYFELVARRQQVDDPFTAIIRIEELSPFPYQEIEKEIAKYDSSVEWIWFQEEHQNMGAWSYVAPLFADIFNSWSTLRYIGRKASGVTAIGVSKWHQAEVAQIFEEVFPTNLKE